MVKVLCELDGLNFVMFHGEQQTGWEYRWRLLGDLPPPYLEWREGTAAQPCVKVQSELRGGMIEVEWRASADADWSQAALHGLVPHRLELEVSASAAFVLEKGTHSAIAVVRDHLARYFFSVGEDVEIRPDAPLLVTGHADAPVPANVLLFPGEFTTRDGVLTVRNTGPSRDWSQPLGGPLVLTESPHLRKRKLFARS